jgi:hypothetical protein
LEIVGVELTREAKTVTVGWYEGSGGLMIRVTLAAFLAGVGGALVLPLAAQAESGASWSGPSRGPALTASAATDLSAQRRPRTRIRIFSNSEPDGVYPRYNLGPNAVRVCNASYVQEFRPSGTVIVPRMSCYWRR